MSVLQVRTLVCFTSFCAFSMSDLMPVLQFDIISDLEVRPYACFTSSTLCLFYKFDLMSVVQVRPDTFLQVRHFVCFKSSILCLFYKFDLIPVLPYACFRNSTFLQV